MDGVQILLGGQQQLTININAKAFGEDSKGVKEMSSTQIEIVVRIPSQPSSKSSSQIYANPYELIKIMNKTIGDLKQQIEEYELALDSMRKEKQTWVSQKKRLQCTILEILAKLEQFRCERSGQSAGSINLISRINIFGINPYKNYNIVSPTSNKKDYTSIRRHEKLDSTKSGLFDLREVAAHNNINKKIDDNFSEPVEQYIPQPIRLSAQSKSEIHSLSLINNTLQNFQKPHCYGENIIEAFVVIGPQIAEFKRKRPNNKSNQITVKPTSLYCHGKHYKQHKSEFMAEIARRAFPEGCRLTRKSFEHNEQLLDLIQYKANHILSEDYFVFTLKGDQSLFAATSSNPNLRKTFLYISNPNYFLFIVCLKLPDFVYVRQQKNYQRKENQIWVGEKIYAIATYYPFFNIHTQILCRVHSIMSKIMIRKILVENENILMWSLAKTIYDLEKNQEINDTLSYFMSKKPDYNHVCYQSAYYFGTLPEFGFKSQYAMLLYCCPTFLSNFSYEEMLLMLTSVLCQKTLIFMSRSQTQATLSALFLINLISPFQYYETVLLNCDSQKVREMIFEFPFPMVCSIKRTDDNLEEILCLFAESNTMRLADDDAQYIVVDVDSNSILYHPALEKLFSSCICEPSKNTRQAYLAVNSCKSKSFSLPTELARENYKPSSKPKSEGEKRMQQIRRNVKEYLEKIAANQTKLPVYQRSERHEQVAKLLTAYIQDLTINAEGDYEVINKLGHSSKASRLEIVKAYLLERKQNTNRHTLISKFVESQMYANYLDTILMN